MPDNTTSTPFFRTRACSGCHSKPCEYLRYGNLFSGNIVLVHNSRFGGYFHDCPLTVKAAHEVEYRLSSLPFQELIDQAQQLLMDSDSAERLHFDFTYQLTDYFDFRERIDYLLMLWRNGVFSILQPPVSLSKNKELYREFYGFEGLIPGKKPEEEEKVEPEEEEQPEITNLQWKKDGNVISKAHVDDMVDLTADVRDIYNGTPVVCLIYIINYDKVHTQLYTRWTKFNYLTQYRTGV